MKKCRFLFCRYTPGFLKGKRSWELYCVIFHSLGKCDEYLRTCAASSKPDARSDSQAGAVTPRAGNVCCSAGGLQSSRGRRLRILEWEIERNKADLNNKWGFLIGFIGLIGHNKGQGIFMGHVRSLNCGCGLLVCCPGSSFGGMSSSPTSGQQEVSTSFAGN